MINRSWLHAALVSFGLTALVVGCDDFEQQMCETDWECREHFGVGHTCEEETGFCQAPEIPEACTRGVHFPPEIFTSRAARDTITLGMMFDRNGRHAYRAATLAAELANLKGGASNLFSINFSAVVCEFDSEAPSASEVIQVARFLRDDVGASAIITGLGAETFWHAREIFEGAAGSQLLVVSANGDFMETSLGVRSVPNVWSMGVAEQKLFYRQGQQLAFQQLKPYVEDCQIEPTPQARLDCAYSAYAASLSPSLSTTLRFHALVTKTGTVSGDIDIPGGRQAALQEGVDSVFQMLRGALPPLDVTVAYRERLIVECDPDSTGGLGEGGSNALQCAQAMDVGVNNVLFCEDDMRDPDSGGENDLTGCSASNTLVADGIYLHTDSSDVVTTFYRQLGSEKYLEALKNSIGTTGPALKQTHVYLPPVASAGALGYYSQIDSEEFLRHDDFFEVVNDGRFLGVRQAANPLTPSHVEYATATDIFFGQGAGFISYYSEQAYDATWVAMASIATSVAGAQTAFPQAAHEFLQNHGKLSHTVLMRFTGTTVSEAEELSADIRDEVAAGNFDEWVDFDYQPQGTPVRWSNEDLRTERWLELLQLFGYDYGSGQELDSFKTYLFNASSGQARFDALDEANDPHDRRLRSTYDYSVWTVRTFSRVVDEPGTFVLDPRCRPGVLARMGVLQSQVGTTDESGRKETGIGVCPSDISICTVTWNAAAEDVTASQVNGWRRIGDELVLEPANELGDACIPWELLGIDDWINEPNP